MTSRRDVLKQKLEKSHSLFTVALQVPSEGGGIGRKEIQVLARKELMMRDLVRQVLRKYLPENELPESDFIFFEKQQPVPDNRYIYDMTTGTSLRLERRNTNLAQTLALSSGLIERIYLQEVMTGEIFEIAQFPAVIGRIKQTQTMGSLEVNLGDMEKGKTVSGKHAQITRDETYIYIENLTQDNRLEINNQRVDFGSPQPIKNNDTILVGRVLLTIKITGA